MTSAVQPDIDLWNLFVPPQAFPLHWKDSRKQHLGLHAFDPHSQSHPVTRDMFKVPGPDILTLPIIKQQEKQYKGQTSLGSFFAACCSMQVPSKQQTSLDSKSSANAFCTPRGEFPHYYRSQIPLGINAWLIRRLCCFPRNGLLSLACYRHSEPVLQLHICHPPLARSHKPGTLLLSHNWPWSLAALPLCSYSFGLLPLQDLHEDAINFFFTFPDAVQFALLFPQLLVLAKHLLIEHASSAGKDTVFSCSSLWELLFSARGLESFILPLELWLK